MKGFDDPQVVLSYCESLTMDENNKLLMGNLRPWIDIFLVGNGMIITLMMGKRSRRDDVYK